MAAPDEVDKLLAGWRGSVEKALDQWLPPEHEPPQDLHRAMRYAVFPSGKRLRPLLTLASAHAVGDSIDAALPGACAIELVHSFSLVHDDLPALDNDDLRRGRPTLHRAFGEALALLAGDALLTRAFQILTAGPGDPSRRLAAIDALAEAAGTTGMIGGQVDDLEAAGEGPDPERVESIHRRKTGALMAACARIGGLLSGGSDEEVRTLAGFGERIGLAFQIVDDLLDRLGSEREVGKAVRKDETAGKLTFPAVWGIEASQRRALELAGEAKRSLAPWGARAAALLRIADDVVERSR